METLERSRISLGGIFADGRGPSARANVADDHPIGSQYDASQRPGTRRLRYRHLMMSGGRAVEWALMTTGARLLAVARAPGRRTLALIVGVWATLVVVALAGWGLDATAVVIAAGIPAAFLPLAFLSAVLQAAAVPPAPPLTTRIEQMAAALNEAAGLVEDLEGEIRLRAAAVEKVRADLERYEHLAEIKSEEARAVAESIQAAMRVEQRRSLPMNLGINVTLMVVGAILGAVLQALLT